MKDEKKTEKEDKKKNQNKKKDEKAEGPAENGTQTETVTEPATETGAEVPEEGLSPASFRFDPDDYPGENPYYEKIANRFRTVKFLLIALLFLFLAGMILLFRNDITIENFRYLIKDLDFSSLRLEGTPEPIIYESAVNSEFGLFKDELVVVRSGSTTIYNMTGSAVFTETNSFTSPRLLTSDRYFLAYDMGDSSATYAIYNSFSLLKTDKAAYPITAAALSEAGYYAIATRDVNYRGVVEIYDPDFSLISRVYKDKLLMDLSFAPDGKTLLILSAYEKNGTWNGEVMICNPYSENGQAQITFDGSLPLRAAFTADGGFTVMTDDGLYFYDATYTQRSARMFENRDPILCDIGSSQTVVAFNVNVLGNEKLVRVYDSVGVLQYSAQLPGQILDTYCNGTTLMLLYEDHLTRILLSDGSQESVPVAGNCLRLLPSPVESCDAFLCYSGSAYGVTLGGSGEETDET